MLCRLQVPDGLCGGAAPEGVKREGVKREGVNTGCAAHSVCVSTACIHRIHSQHVHGVPSQVFVECEEPLCASVGPAEDIWKEGYHQVWLSEPATETIGSIVPTFFAAVAVVGILTGLWPIAAFGALGLVTTTVATVWNRVSLEEVVYERRFPYHRALIGEELTMSLSLTNRKPVPLTWVRVEDEVPDELRVAGERDAGGGLQVSFDLAINNDVGGFDLSGAGRGVGHGQVTLGGDPTFELPLDGSAVLEDHLTLDVGVWGNDGGLLLVGHPMDTPL